MKLEGGHLWGVWEKMGGKESMIIVFVYMHTTLIRKNCNAPFM